MDIPDESRKVLPTSPDDLPALVHLRGTFFCPEEIASISMEKQSTRRSNLHAIPLNQDYLIVHTQSSVALHHLPTQTVLWEIICSSFKFALDSRQQFLALTPGDLALSVNVWDMRTGHIVHQLSYRKSGDPFHICPNGLALSPDGRILAAGLEGEEETLVVLWDMATGRPFGTLETGDYDDITALAFHPSGKLLAGASFNNRNVWFWNLSDGHLLNVWEVECADRPYDLAFNADGTQLLVGWGNCGLRVWDMEERQEVPGFAEHLHPTRMTIAPDGHSLAVAHFGGVRMRDIRILEMGTWRLLHTFPGNIPSESFSTDGQVLATMEEHGHIYVWQVATEQLLYML